MEAVKYHPTPVAEDFRQQAEDFDFYRFQGQKALLPVAI
jgi:hypothetical protein